jgi:hypothetical protein
MIFLHRRYKSARGTFCAFLIALLIWVVMLGIGESIQWLR